MVVQAIQIRTIKVKLAPTNMTFRLLFLVYYTHIPKFTYQRTANYTYSLWIQLIELIIIIHKRENKCSEKCTRNANSAQVAPVQDDRNYV